MIVRLLSIGARPPIWLREGFDEYARRLQQGVKLELREVTLPKGSGDSSGRGSDKLLGEIPAGARVVALDRGGDAWDTIELAAKLEDWQLESRVVCLLIGGPDGLTRDAVDRADECWSLSRLTFPHMLVRVMVAEQIYRAWSYNTGHPYHRQ